MGYAPSQVASPAYPAIRKPAIGGEAMILFAPGNALEVGTLTITGADTGTWAANADVTLPAAGTPLVAMVKTLTGIDGGTENLVVTIAGTDDGDQAINGVASIMVPGYSRNATKFFRVGLAADAVVSGDDGFKTITGVTIACDADAAGGVIAIYQLPAIAAFTEILGKVDVSFPSKAAVPIAIPEGLDGGAYTKFGRTEVPQFQATARHFTNAEGFAKFAGAGGVLLVKTVKESVHADSVFLTGAKFSDSTSLPDGNGEAQLTVSGLYEQQLVLLAPTA